jgi:hypothetical protein
MPVSQHKDEFKIKFDGQLHQIDANTLINSLINLSTIIQEVNTELHTNQKIEIKIKALDQGSFDIHCHLVQGISAFLPTVPLIAQVSSIENIKTIIDAFVSLLNLKKLLKGEKPNQVNEDGDNLSIENSRGDTIVVFRPVYNMYEKNPAINNALSKSFESLQSEPSVTDLKILTTEETVLFSASRNEFGEMASKNEALTANTQSIIKNGVTLNIFKLIFENRKNKWDFLYEGNKISAQISDDSFFDRIDNGESFSKGDSLIVNLQIDQTFDQAVNGFINSSYQVNRVIEHIPRPQQQPIKFE